MPSAFYLLTSCADDGSGVCDGDDGTSCSLDSLPASIVERVTAWRDDYRAHDRVWLDSGPGELDAYRQLADVSSSLAIKGRSLARAIEDATGVPTYYWLMRHWARAGEDDRPCPGCGGAWRQPGDGRGLARFEFRCAPCRLISDVPPDLDGDEPRFAVGEWNGER